MYKRADLHLHTTASDGSDKPSELIKKARERGIDLIAITDHDTLVGSREALSLDTEGVRVITGIEFSCRTAGEDGFDCHILGYGFDPDSRALNDAIEHGRQMRLLKLESRLAYLKNTFGITFTKGDVEWLHSLNSVARPHLGMLLISHGYVKTMAEAMDKYLKGGGFPDDRIDAGEAIAAIRAAGGVAVYAHPIGGERERRLTREEVIPRIERLASLGVVGIECYYSRYSEEDEDMLVGIARERGLFLSGGSDYHGENKTVKLGVQRADESPIDIEKITVLSAILGG